MKRIKFLVLIVLALLLAGSVLFACSEITEDHTSLLQAGSIYRVAYDADGGGIGGAREAFMYYESIVGLKLADPAKEEFVPTKPEQFIKRWYYKDIVKSKDSKGNDIETVNKIEWTFAKDVFTQDLANKYLVEMLDEKTGITFYEFRLFPEWEYFLYVDYCISYVDIADTSVSVGTLKSGDKETVVTDKALKQDELATYRGESISHTSGTAVPDSYDIVKYPNIDNASQIKQLYYSDAELQNPMTFPINSGIAPRPEKDKNRIKVYVKFFNVQFTILATPRDLTGFSDTNYYLWRDIDFTTSDGQKAIVTASDKFENKIFVGNNHKISNLRINSNQTTSVTWNLGMFGTITNSEIRDVEFENCAVYFNMAHNITGINCGLLAGSISGGDTKINNVKLTEVRGYVRNNYSDIYYNARYSESKDFVYNNTVDGTGTPAINVTTTDVSINYYNIHMQAAEKTSDIGFSSWNTTNVEFGLQLQFGALNEQLKNRAADGKRPAGYYIGVDVWLTEIEDVVLDMFGRGTVNADEINATGTTGDGFIIYKLETKEGWHIFRVYVAEDIKGGFVTANWNSKFTTNSISDSYGYLVTGGSADITNARNLGNSGAVPVTNQSYNQTLIYGAGTEIKYHTVPQDQTQTGLRVRPEGYSIPIRVRLFSDITKNEAAPTTVTIKDASGNSTEYDVLSEEIDIKTQTGVAHYFEFWQQIDKDAPSTTITISFYGGRYDLVINLVKASNATFEAHAVEQPDDEDEPGDQAPATFTPSAAANEILTPPSLMQKFQF